MTKEDLKDLCSVAIEAGLTPAQQAALGTAIQRIMHTLDAEARCANAERAAEQVVPVGGERAIAYREGYQGAHDDLAIEIDERLATIKLPTP